MGIDILKKEGLPVVKQRVQNLFKKALYNDKQALRELLVIMDFRARPAVAKTLRNMGIYDEGYLQAAMTEGYIEFTKLWVRGSFIKFKEYEFFI